MDLGTIAMLTKHLHVWLVVLSVGGFILRFLWSQNDSSYLQHRLTKTVPHLVDALLLLSGVSLAAIYSLSPVTTSWLGLKIGLIVVYIILGYLALKPSLPKTARLFAGVAALPVVFYIASLAVYKHV